MEFVGSSATHLGLAALTARLGLAVLLCGAIGLERELRDKAAGLRTTMLVGLAAAVFTIVTVEVARSLTRDDTIVADPIRAVNAVTSGVAFIAAGSIIGVGGNVRGLTTGASLWLAGAVGLTCGAGYFSVAIVATGFGLLVLTVLALVEKALGFKRGTQSEAPPPGTSAATEKPVRSSRAP